MISKPTFNLYFILQLHLHPHLQILETTTCQTQVMLSLVFLQGPITILGVYKEKNSLRLHRFFMKRLNNYNHRFYLHMSESLVDVADTYIICEFLCFCGYTFFFFPVETMPDCFFNVFFIMILNIIL